MGTETDVIDLLAGIEPGSSLDGIRIGRLRARENAQKAISPCSNPSIFATSPPQIDMRSQHS